MLNSSFLYQHLSVSFSTSQSNYNVSKECDHINWEAELSRNHLMCRSNNDGTYQGTTWRIIFKLDSVNQSGMYKLRIAIASASLAEVQVH